ncbi:hypothetical protein ACA910_019630 [Epithemia clementina (nom. ined.)]
MPSFSLFSFLVFLVWALSDTVTKKNGVGDDSTKGGVTAWTPPLQAFLSPLAKQISGQRLLRLQHYHNGHATRRSLATSIAFRQTSSSSSQVILRNAASDKQSSTSQKGFGFSAAKSSQQSKNKNKKKKAVVGVKRKDDIITEQQLQVQLKVKDKLIQQYQTQAAQSCLGHAVEFAKQHKRQIQKGVHAVALDPFWEWMPSLIHSKFPKVKDSELQRVAGLLRHSLCPDLSKNDDQGDDDPKMRPLDDIHAYIPGLGPTQPFYDPNSLDDAYAQAFVRNYDIIRQEYHALLQDMEQSGQNRFQSVTNMNYESGWKTLVLFYNGHRIPNFPYHLCPTTTKLLESLPLAGRIAGFNRQQPQTGIPRHTDGNNMWLTCQMGLIVPGDEGQDDNANENDSIKNRAYITVGQETWHYKKGECLVYDTTYWHETFNPHPTQERVVLHVDFFNPLALTSTEIQILQYIYSLREQFMKAEGVAKVEAQQL